MKMLKFLLFCAAVGVIFSTSITTTQAQTQTFAQFSEDNLTQDFVFTNNAPSANATFTTVAGGSPVTFRFSPGILNLDTSLRGPQSAILTITPTTTTTAATQNGGSLNQPLNQTIVIRITRINQATVGNGNRTNLLTATISTNTSAPEVSGNNNGGSATFDASTPNQTVTFTSDFVSFINTTDRDLSFSFSSVTPTLTLDTNSFLRSFTAAGTGTFASNPIPVVAAPTAAPASISGQVFTPFSRGLRGARVDFVGTNGVTRSALTNAFGYYLIPDVEVGQTAVLTVASKRYTFAPQIMSINEDLSGVNFVAQ